MNLTLRDRLAAKTRRRVVVPVQVAEMSEDAAAELLGLQRSALTAAASGDLSAMEGLADRVDALREGATVPVAFVATDAFEKVLAAYPDDEGGTDWLAALPMLAGLCAEDESLQDDAAWVELFGAWSHGEKLTLWSALLNLNTAAPSPTVPKG